MPLLANNNDSVHNVTGAYLFTAYVLASLLLTTLIAVDLYQAYRYRPSLSSKQSHQVSKQLQVFVALAVLNFSTLSYHMLSYLIFSYQDWAEPKGLAIRPTLYLTKHPRSSSNLGFIAHLWQWLTESTLFFHFAKTICENSANFWWTLHALHVSAGSALFLSIEGKEGDQKDGV